MTYCEEIHPVQLEDSWIVPLDVIEREMPPPYVDPSKPGRGRYKRWRGVGESFPTRKIKCSMGRKNKKSSKMTISKKNYIESLPRELLIDIIERIASCCLKDLMRVKLSSKILNQVANEPSVYQKVTLVNFPYRRWSIVQEAISFLEMCRASGNLEALYIKGVYDFLNRSNSNGLGMLSQAADGGHIGASYVVAIISIFNCGEFMRESLMFIANMKKTKPLKVECWCHNLICWEEDPFVALLINLSESVAGMVVPWEATMKMIFVVIYRELLIDIVERIDSYSLKDLMRVKLRSSIKSLMNLLYIRRCTSFLEMCRASGNLEALYRKGVYAFFNRSDSNGLRMFSQATDGGDIGACYVLAIISIFNVGESIREGLMVPEPHLLGERPICCTAESPTFVVNY
ncbi:hypothetical protein H5410_021702, partial [Solanum commersonii]